MYVAWGGALIHARIAQKSDLLVERGGQKYLISPGTTVGKQFPTFPMFWSA